MGGRGSGGHNYVPPGVKRARGTYRRDRAQARAEGYASYRRATPAMPRGLPEPVQRAWRKIVPPLCARGILCKLDQDGLIALCNLTAQVAAGTASRRTISEWMAWKAQFGMTKSSYHRVPVLPKPDEEDSNDR
jgi:hypothetical protein